MPGLVASSCIGKILRFALLVLMMLSGEVSAADDCGCLPCDFDLDGDVDMADFGHLQACLSGYGVVQTDPNCQDARLAGHTYVDQQDIVVFRTCLAGEQHPYPGQSLPAAVITEFVASNDGGLADEDGDHPDWIELYVPCLPSLDLSGWYLANSANNLQKWSFPSVVLHRGDYLVIFASGKDRRTPGQPLHTNFQLDKDGEYLALVAPDGQTIVHSYAPSFPDQVTNVSYGTAQGTMILTPKGSAATLHVPEATDGGLGGTWTQPEFADETWYSGATGLGFSSVPTVFQVTTYKANVAVNNLATAESVLADPAKQAWNLSGQMPVVNLLNTGDGGHYGADQSFPGLSLVTDVNDFVTLVTGTIVIPTAGEWTFGVNSSDGFSLTLTQGTRVFASNFPDVQEAADTLHVFNVTSPGVYNLRLVQFERTGGAGLELFAARGYYVSFDPAVFRLVGDVAGGGLTLGGLGLDVLTNLGPAMQGVNSSVWIRIPFELVDPTIYNSLQLQARYADGFVAYLNGQELCRRNTPVDLTWNAAAIAQRSGAEAAATETIALPGAAALLRAGRNVLAIHGLNNAVADGDFAIVPELVASSNSLQPQYFPTPTPGGPNGASVDGLVHGLTFNPPHGFRNAPFQLSIDCPTPGTSIRYTLDGSTPTESSGLLYTGPLTVGGTSVVRAAAFRSGWLPSPVMTQTYLFISDVLVQSPQGQAPGAAWPAPGSLNGQSINYGMDPDIVNSAIYGSLVDDALLALPSISLVTDLPNLFSASTGIYTHASADGRDWERPCSLEWLNPDGTPGFQTNAGVRIRGGFSRTGSNPKHAFRLFFRAEYGNKELEYPIFGTLGVSNFRKIDLRTDQNYSWSFGGDSRNTMVRENFVRACQGAMGEAYTRSRSCHLYIDGVYWGIYHFQERAEAEYAASYFGGDDDDYDVIKVDAGPYTIYATDGTTAAWYRLWQACGAGFGTDAAYNKVQGLNEDGTRNPDYEVLVDVDNTIDCALLTYWSGDLDGPISAFLGNNSPNNFYAIRNRDGQSGFKCFKHDCEHTLLDVNEDRTGPWSGGSNFAQFNPQYLSQRLATNAEYRVRFGDRVQKHLFNLGTLAPQNAAARFMAWANTLDVAIIAESARWGDAQRHPPLNRNDHWVPEISWVVNSYLPARNAKVISQLRNDGLYPTVAAPLLSHYGGQVTAGLGLGLSRPSGQSGTIYYTTDGTDPRVRGGAVAAEALVFSDSASSVVFVPAGSVWRYLDTGSEQAGWQAAEFDDAAWPQGPAQLGYSPDENDEATVISYGPDSNNKYPTTWFRKSFTVPAGTVCTSLTCRLLCDDGAVVYLNGHQAAVTSTMGSSWDATTYCGCTSQENTFVQYVLDPNYLNVGGENVLAVEVHQCVGNSSDLSFDLELAATVQSSPLLIDHNLTLKARIRDNGQWSALVEATFITQPVNLVINEFMADNAATIQDPDEPDEYPDWVELYNPYPIDLDLGGMYLTDNFGNPTKFRIANGVVIAANGRLVFWLDDDGTQGNLHTNFKLSKDGEQLGLYATDGVTLIDGLNFDAQTTDVSYGRYPDGGAAWGLLSSPTPGQPNAPLQ